jgi:quercetin dioxygenase-like cupin family protein
MTSPFVVAPAQHHPLKVLGETISVLASAEATGSYEVFLQSGPEGVGPPPHTHPWDESYYVLAGKLEVLLGDRTVVLSPGELAFVPRGTPHCFRIMANDTKFLSFNSERGASKFFEELDHEVGGAVDLPKIVAVAQRHEVHFAMPPK